jgi:hypothetical protein
VHEYEYKPNGNVELLHNCSCIVISCVIIACVVIACVIIACVVIARVIIVTSCVDAKVDSHKEYRKHFIIVCCIRCCCSRSRSQISLPAEDSIEGDPAVDHSREA